MTVGPGLVASGAPASPAPQHGAGAIRAPWLRPDRFGAHLLVGLVAAIGAGGAAYVLTLVLLMEAAKLGGFLVGFTPDDIARQEALYVLVSAALACAVLAGVLAGVAQPAERRWWRHWSVGAVAARLDSRGWAFAVIGIAMGGYLAYGRLVFVYQRMYGGTDQGMYLAASRVAMSGGVTYHDFPFIQGPLYPYILGAFMAPFSFSEAAARIYALVATAACLLLTAYLATRLAGYLAGVIAFLLVLGNLDFIGDATGGIQPGGAAGSLLLLLGACLFAARRPLWAVVPLAAAVGIRVLFAPIAVVGVLTAVVMLREARRPLLLGGALALAIFTPFVVVDPRGALFGIIGHQSQRGSIVPRVFNTALPETFAAHLRSIQVGSLTYLGAYWPMLVALLLLAAVVSQSDARARLGRERLVLLTFLALGSVLMFLVDLLPYPFMVQYPVPQVPLLSVVGGVAASTLLRQRVSPLAAQMVGALTVVVLLANPYQATRDGPGSLNFLERFGAREPIRELNEIAAYVERVTPPDGIVITLETSVATQAKRKLWPGLEVTVWGILTIPDADARAVHMLTPNLFEQAIASEKAAAVIASDKYTWGLGTLPDGGRVRRTLAEHYDLARSFDGPSDWGVVGVYLPKGARDSASP